MYESFRSMEEYYRDLENQQKDLPGLSWHQENLVVCRIVMRTPLCSCHNTEVNSEKYEML